MQINKNTTTSYVPQRERDGGMISQGIGRGKYSNLWANGENPNVKGRTHKAVNYPFCLLWPIIYLFQKLVELVNALGMEEYGSQICIWEATHFWKMYFWLMGQVNAQKCFPTHYAFKSFISSHSWSLLSSLLHILCNYLHFHGWEKPYLFCWVNVQ